ncbi:hypothetical protein PT2222_40382 [Paraburkholderia tropica]
MRSCARYRRARERAGGMAQACRSRDGRQRLEQEEAEQGADQRADQVRMIAMPQMHPRQQTTDQDRPQSHEKHQHDWNVVCAVDDHDAPSLQLVIVV